jgi:methylphosphotriester-DNA--protein-cysteine methyltransferase
MFLHSDLPDGLLHQKIRNGEVAFGGNLRLKIYGTLRCKSGKRMKKENRVFFGSGQEAVAAGYRPCAHCMNKAYREWKTTNSHAASVI